MTRSLSQQFAGTNSAIFGLVDVSPAIGGPWKPHPDYAGNLFDGSDARIFGAFGTTTLVGLSQTDPACYLAGSSCDAATFNCYAALNVTFTANAGKLGVVYGVKRNKFKTFYLARFSLNLAEIVSFNNGTQSVLGTLSSTTILSGTSAIGTVAVSFDGSAHRIASSFQLGTFTLTATDSSLAGVGAQGLWWEPGTSTLIGNMGFGAGTNGAIYFGLNDSNGTVAAIVADSAATATTFISDSSTVPTGGAVLGGTAPVDFVANIPPAT